MKLNGLRARPRRRGLPKDQGARSATGSLFHAGSHAAPAPRHYQLPSLEVVDLSYAGRLSPSHPAHDAIASAQVGDELRLAHEGDRWMLYDRNNRPLGRMARSWQPPEGTVFLKGMVGAVVRWRKSDNDEHYQQWIKREEWETVLPELEFRAGPM